MENKKHWAKQKEAGGGFYGIKIMLFLYKIGGNLLFIPVLYLIMSFFYLISKESRKNSKYFLKKAMQKRRALKISDKKLYSFFHFISFGKMILDKFKAWQNKLDYKKDITFVDGSFEKANDSSHGGKLFLCSHMGNMDALRAIANKNTCLIVNAVVFTKNAAKVTALLNAIAPDSSLNLIATQTIGPDTAIMLKDKIEKGEAVAIVGDRVPVETQNSPSKRISKAKFFDEGCSFSQGPYILAAILQCKVELLFGLYNEDTKKIDIICKDFADRIVLSRKKREADLQKYAQRYAAELEYYATRYPYQWFNFFDFFRQ